MLDSVPI